MSYLVFLNLWIISSQSKNKEATKTVKEIGEPRREAKKELNEFQRAFSSKRSVMLAENKRSSPVLTRALSAKSQQLLTSNLAKPSEPPKVASVAKSEKPLPTLDSFVTRKTTTATATSVNSTKKGPASESLNAKNAATTQITSSSTVNKKVVATNEAQSKQFACLRNLGSTCYMNCIIQVMRYTPGFVSSIHRLFRQIEYLKKLVIIESIEI